MRTKYLKKHLPHFVENHREVLLDLKVEHSIAKTDKKHCFTYLRLEFPGGGGIYFQIFKNLSN